MEGIRRELFDEENDWNRELKMKNVEGTCGVDVLEAVQLKNTGKTARISEITVDLLMVCEKESIRRLYKTANDIYIRLQLAILFTCLIFLIKLTTFCSDLRYFMRPPSFGNFVDAAIWGGEQSTIKENIDESLIDYL